MTAGGVDSEESRCTLEPDRLEVQQHIPDELGALTGRSSYRVADPDQSFGHVAAEQGNFFTFVDHSGSFCRRNDLFTWMTLAAQTLET